MRATGDPAAGRRRPRGRRGRGQGAQWDIVLLNSSGRPQLLSALEQLPRKTTAALLSQEHHAATARVPDLQHQIRARGWKPGVVAAVDTQSGGSSAGVAVVVPSHIGWGSVQKGTWAIDAGRANDGRLAAAWVQVGVVGGILAVSIYLHTNEGMTARNRRLLQAALASVIAFGAPWIIAGDFQTSPQELQEVMGVFIERAGGRIRAPMQPTVYPSVGQPRVIDFAIVSPAVNAAIREVEVDTRIAASPHRAVRFTLNSNAPKVLVQVAKAPRAFPRQLPVGCPRRPVVPAEAPIVIDDLATMTNGEIEEVVTVKWGKLADCIETELCERFDLVGPEGDPLKPYTGRADGVTFVHKPLTPPRATGRLGMTDDAVHAMMWVLNRLEEIIHTMRRAMTADVGLSRKGWEQWSQLVAKFRPPLRGLPAKAAGIDRWWQEAIGQISVIEVESELHRLIDIWQEGRRRVVERKAERMADLRVGWWHWVQEQIHKGAGALHSYVKRHAEIPAEIVTVGNARSGSPQDIVNADMDEWEKIWLRSPAATAPWRQACRACDKERPARPSVAALRRASRTFRAHTAVGCDGVPPRAFSWLSDSLLAALGEFMVVIEAAGVWPRQVALAMMRLIPKSAGGRRPIGILASLVRWWERVRQPEVQKWRMEQARDYNYSARGRRADQAVWRQALTDEAARARGLQSAATLVDLVKAFEMVMLQEVWASAVRHDFPLWALALILEACAFTRRLVYCSAVSRGVQTLTAILAGGGYAADCLFLLLLDPLDRLTRSHPDVRMYLYVDDLTAQSAGTEAAVAASQVKWVRDCISQLEDGLDLKVSRGRPWQQDHQGKTVTVTSSRGLDARIKTGMSAIGVKVLRKTKNLGIDYGPGARKKDKRSIQVGRLAAAEAKRARARCLGRKGAAHIERTQFIPAVRFGIAVTGITDAALKKVRYAAAAAHGPMGRRSTTARLAATGYDPGLEMVLAPLKDWVMDVWERAGCSDEMADAWKRAQQTVGLSDQPHARVEGPAGALIATLRRLRWASPAAHVVKTIDGTLLDMTVTAPRTLIRWAVDDYWMVVGAMSQLALEMSDMDGSRGYPRVKAAAAGGGLPVSCYGESELERVSARVWRGGRFQTLDGRLVPWLDMVWRCVGRMAARGDSQAARSVVAMVEGGWFTQYRLWTIDLVDDVSCKACGEKPGTLQHKIGECKSTADLRAIYLPEWIRKKSVVELWDPIHARGVPALPKYPCPPPDRAWWMGSQPRDGAVADGVAYTDGALRGMIRRAARAGWAVVVADSRHRMKWARYGTCAEPYPSVVRSELRAVLECLRYASGSPLVIYVDNQEVVDGCQKGRKWSTAANRDGADLWRAIWDILDQVGKEISICKVKAHTHEEDIEAGIITVEQRDGNEIADVLAKKASHLAEQLSPTSTFEREMGKAVRYYKWLLVLASNWVNDTSEFNTDEAEKEERADVCGPRYLPRDADKMEHVIWTLKGGTVCRRCGREAATTEASRRLAKTRCLGSAVGRALTRSGIDPTALVRRCAISHNVLKMKGAVPPPNDVTIERKGESDVADGVGDGHWADDDVSGLGADEGSDGRVRGDDERDGGDIAAYADGADVGARAEDGRGDCNAGVPAPSPRSGGIPSAADPELLGSGGDAAATAATATSSASASLAAMAAPISRFTHDDVHEREGQEFPIAKRRRADGVARDAASELIQDSMDIDSATMSDAIPLRAAW